MYDIIRSRHVYSGSVDKIHAGLRGLELVSACVVTHSLETQEKASHTDSDEKQNNSKFWWMMLRAYS